MKTIDTGTFYNEDNTRRIVIEFDDSPLHPREDMDNIETLWCEHGRYSLGDDHAKDELVDAIRELAEKKGIELEEEHFLCPNGHHELTEADWMGAVSDGNTLEGFNEWVNQQYTDCEECDDDGDVENPHFNELCDPQDIVRALEELDPDEEHIFRLPLFLYDHSGITMSTAPFSCSWDSGQVGIAFITREAALEFATENYDQLPEAVKPHVVDANQDYDDLTVAIRDRSHKCIKASVKSYDNFLTGMMVGFRVEVLDKDKLTEYDTAEDLQDDPDAWDEEDSCWGFEWDDPESLLDQIDSDDEEWVRKALGLEKTK